MVIKLEVGPLEANCYIFFDEKTRAAFVIDPGGDAKEIIAIVEKNDLQVKYIINTHGHFDHVGADAELKNSFASTLAIHKEDARLLADSHEHSVIFGVRSPRSPRPDLLLSGGEELKAGGISLKVIHTPGHTRGGISLYSREEGVVFTGDTLFAGSIGRTDFEGGSIDDIMDSIRGKILGLGDSVRVLPGHGPESTVGIEKETNPFVTGDAG